MTILDNSLEWKDTNFVLDKEEYGKYIKLLTVTNIKEVKNLRLFYKGTATWCVLLTKYKASTERMTYEIICNTQVQRGRFLTKSPSFMEELDVGTYIIDVSVPIAIHNFTAKQPDYELWTSVPPKETRGTSLLAIDYDSFHEKAYKIPGNAYLPQIIWIRNKINLLLPGSKDEKMTLFGLYFLTKNYLESIGRDEIAPDALAHFLPEMHTPEGTDRINSELTNKLCELFACSTDAEIKAEENKPLYLTEIIEKGLFHTSLRSERIEINVDIGFSFKYGAMFLDGDTLIIHTSDPKVTASVVRKELGLGDEGYILIYNS